MRTGHQTKTWQPLTWLETARLAPVPLKFSGCQVCFLVVSPRTVQLQTWRCPGTHNNVLFQSLLLQSCKSPLGQSDWPAERQQNIKISISISRFARKVMYCDYFPLLHRITFKVSQFSETWNQFFSWPCCKCAYCNHFLFIVFFFCHRCFEFPLLSLLQFTGA